MPRRKREGFFDIMVAVPWWVGISLALAIYVFLQHHRAHEAKIVCIGEFTLEARRFAHGKPIELVSGDDLLALVESVRSP